MYVENNILKLRDQIIKCMEDATKECAITVTADVQSVTPVGSKEKGSISPGALKRSITFNTELTDTHSSFEVGSPLIYARKVEFENKSYLRSTFKSDIKKFENIYIKHLRKVFD